ncbi:hypothetical protein Tco_1086133 [Tanacetum coccineum]
MRHGLLRMLRRRQSLLTPYIPKAKLLHVRTVHWNSWGDEGHLRSRGKEQPVRSSWSPQEARGNIVSIGASTLTTDVGFSLTKTYTKHTLTLTPELGLEFKTQGELTVFFLIFSLRDEGVAAGSPKDQG